ncbi:MAG: tRNA pseudouridine(38-40) synthase TruA, partial [Bacteroidetes bacterium]|nr:tRNA pseudouridine(38-40) synthase TruA [Bacteroidota bacterium]
MRFRLDISYKGTNFYGWQKQSDKPTVQGTLEEVLSILLRQPVATTGCGRTDTGVHARFFPLHFECEAPIPNHFLYRINSLLPQEIAVLNFEPVSEHFHARFNAISRTYRYYLHFVKDPF